MMMSTAQILQQQARRIVGYSNRRCLFRSHKTVPKTDPVQKANITPMLEQWTKQGYQEEPSCVRDLIKNLRDSNDSNQISKAFEASEWMCAQKGFDIFSDDYAARLYLTKRVLGLEQAEKFFYRIPVSMRDYSVYDTLLSSYTTSENALDKAEATFEKMRKLGFLLKPSPFNSMISLYCQLQNLDMAEKLLGEMKEKKMEVDSVTMKNVLRGYASKSKIKEMETFQKWVEEKGTKLEGDTSIAMAKAYHRTGSIEKAIEMYGDVAGSEREVYSLWDEYKKSGKEEEDSGYRSMISSLLKLDDVKGAEKIYGEWKPQGDKLDISIPGLLISRFYAGGDKLKVDEMVESIRKKRNGMLLRKLKKYLLSFGIVGPVKAMVKSIRKKSNGMDLKTLKEGLYSFGGTVVGVIALFILLALVVLAFAIEVAMFVMRSVFYYLGFEILYQIITDKEVSDETSLDKKVSDETSL